MTFKKIMALVLATLMLVSAMAITASAAGSAEYALEGVYDYDAKTYTLNVVYYGDTALTVTYGVNLGTVDADFTANVTSVKSSETLPKDMGVASTDGSVAGTGYYANDAYSTTGIADATILASATISNVEPADYAELVEALESASAYDLNKDIAGKYSNTSDKYIAILDGTGDVEDNATEIEFKGFSDVTSPAVTLVGNDTSKTTVTYEADATPLKDYTFTVEAAAGLTDKVIVGYRYTGETATTTLEATGNSYTIPALVVVADIDVVITYVAANLPSVTVNVDGSIGDGSVNGVVISVSDGTAVIATKTYNEKAPSVTFDLVAGTYTITVEKAGYISVTETAEVVADAEDIVIDAELIAGDVTADDSIGDDDISTLAGAFIQAYNSELDVNEDDYVNIWDMGYAVINYGA